MTTRSGPLIGRDAECAVLDRLVAAVRAGESRALVVHGEAGIGKTALLEYLASNASGCRVVSTAGVESEMELAFAALHQLCAAFLSRLPVLPEPQRDALSTTFGVRAGPVPERFVVGLATLSLSAEVAADRPLLCLVDDEQWLDRASAGVLAFVARRLGAESVGLVFGARVVSRELGGMPDLAVTGLSDADSQSLLGWVLRGPVDAEVRDQLVAESHGNPLALLELPRASTTLAGGFGLPGALGLSATVEDGFRRRTAALPSEARRLLLLAAAEPLGDPVLLWRAAAKLRISSTAAQPAKEAGLIEFGGRVRFRHPLVRSAAYRSASVEEKQQVHRALAEATDPAVDSDRRAWHLAEAATGPDEVVAAELQHAAGRAEARGGMAAAACSSAARRR